MDPHCNELRNELAPGRDSDARFFLRLAVTLVLPRAIGTARIYYGQLIMKPGILGIEGERLLGNGPEL